MKSISVDVEVMAKGSDNLKNLLFLLVKLRTLFFKYPFNQERHVVTETLIHRVIGTFGPPKLLIVDEYLVFTGEIIEFNLEAINC